MKYIRLIRLKQWVKNVFVLMPVFFSGHLFEWDYIIPSILAFFAFCFISSSIYIFNDIFDVNSDRLHPEKKKRPIASGSVSINAGWILMLICIIFSASIIVLELLYSRRLCLLWAIIVLYFIMNILYSLYFKHKPILDVLIIASGFVLRIIAGSVTTGIYVSHWIILMTFLLSLFLGFSKRRNDVVLYEKNGINTRETVKTYNLEFLNSILSIIASVTLVCYIMYTLSDEVMIRLNNKYLYVSSIFVLAGIIKYLQTTIVDNKSGDPTEILFKNHFIQGCIIGWVLTFLIILYA